MSINHAQNAIKGWALVDALVTVPLVAPITARLYIEMTYHTQAMLGVSTPAAPAVLSGLTLLFASITGLLGVLWALARWSRPVARFGWTDVAGRLWVGGLFTHFILNEQIPLTFWVFVVIEWLGALHQTIRLHADHAGHTPQ